jgi:Mg2+-importing ATPase
MEQTVEQLLKLLGTSEKGLKDEEARRRLKVYGANKPVTKKEFSIPWQILVKLTNPLVVVLLVVAGFSYFLNERVNAFFVIIMAIMSVFLSFIQEFRASREAEKLSALVHTLATVFRNGRLKELKIAEIVPGDIIEINAGNMVPADLRLIHNKDLFINEASLTGESLPVEKFTDDPLNNLAYMGSAVVSGTALGVVVKTGKATKYGELSKAIANAPPPTSFDKGIRDFTWLMIRFMVIFVVLIFAINVFWRGNIIEAFLFSLAVAVGLTPEMMPMLVTVNLSRGALDMAAKEVIVKRLSSIQNLGAMDILCTDKTGTLTQDRIILEKHCDVLGREDEGVLRLAFINSYYQTGLKNLLDKAILRHEKMLLKESKKIDEIPFDFDRKLMSVVIEHEGVYRLITKGAPEELFARCTHCELANEVKPFQAARQETIKKEYDALSKEGFRVIALAYKDVSKSQTVFSRNDENQLTLKGYLAFLDPPKPSAKEAVLALKRLGIELKVLTGDNELVTQKICREIDLELKGVVTGAQIDKVNEAEIKTIVRENTVFVRLTPLQKERIIRSLQAQKRTVGFLGDGINDGAALKAADVGISVNNAADIAKETADIILLRKSLRVLKEAVVEGRRTFGNINKYIKMGSSSNFGNMLSLTGGTLFLPFLPMLPVQILLNNFLYDLSQLAIPTDAVDKDYLVKPRPWNIKAIKNFMLIIGPVSSIFDFLTYALMLFVFSAAPALFHTGWFLESLTTQTLVIYVIRTGKVPFLQSWPSRYLMITSAFIIALGFGLVFSPFANGLGFIDLPPLYFLFLALIVGAYLGLVQLVKTWFIQHFGSD